MSTQLTAVPPVGAGGGHEVQQPVTIPVSRYIDPAFAAVETARLWPRVWQLACSTDHVAEPGDAYEYRCGPYSIIIVRDGDGVLRGFENACRHRGSAICEGAASGLTELRCPFHRWSWDLAGRLQEIPSRKTFGPLPSEEYGLAEVAVDVWGPMVFVDPSRSAGPLSDFLDGVPQDIAWVGLDEFACDYLITVPLPGNWKTISDGFSETYHVQGIHREMLPTVDDVTGPQFLWRHHGKLEQRYGVPSPRYRTPPGDDVTWSAFVEVMGSRIGVTDKETPVPEVPEGSTLSDVLAAMVRGVGASQGVSYDRFSTEQLLTMQQYNLFPNVSLVIFPDIVSVLRSRPGATPDDGFLDVFTYRRAPLGAARNKPADVTLPCGTDGGITLILDQDVANIDRAQRGLHQPGFTRMTLSNEERRILNFHRNLEAWLNVHPTEIGGASAELRPAGTTASPS